MESLVPKWEGYKAVFEEKMREFDTLQEALRSLRCTSSDQLCFSKEELDHLVMETVYLNHLSYSEKKSVFRFADYGSVLMW